MGSRTFLRFQYSFSGQQVPSYNVPGFLVWKMDPRILFVSWA